MVDRAAGAAVSFSVSYVVMLCKAQAQANYVPAPLLKRVFHRVEHANFVRRPDLVLCILMLPLILLMLLMFLML